MRKIISISLIMGLLALFLLVSCDNQNDTNDAGNLSQNDGQQDMQEQEDEPTENIKLEPNVPEDLDLDGYQFRIVYNAKLNSPYEDDRLS